MAAVLEGRVDALLLTAGMAYSTRPMAYSTWRAPAAEGVFRVLNGEEQVKILQEAESAFAPRRERLVVQGPE